MREQGTIRHLGTRSESDVLREAYKLGGYLYGDTEEGYRRWLRAMNTSIGRELDLLGFQGDPRRNVTPFNPRAPKQ